VNPDTEDGVYSRQGFGGQLPLRPPFGLLLVDFVVGFADPEVFGGGNIPQAIARSRVLLAQARTRHWPVAHSRIVYAADGSDANIFSEKIPGMLRLTEQAPESQIVAELSAAAGEHIVRKTTPSAFFGTSLAAWLTQRQVATLVIGGCVTSGCVRATVVDAMCHGFRPVVIADCVGDRAHGPHEASLFDLRQKYAEVRKLDALLTALD
jgi:maleamate amidohydrolase